MDYGYGYIEILSTSPWKSSTYLELYLDIKYHFEIYADVLVDPTGGQNQAGVPERLDS